ncbi:undecaprenyl/decaprenyl-phosphate alpha-N-acetylglucosaminyl 1-phosphate transferase [Fictibacillus nanhaiensis]|uniref:Undecaprenyl/decaprenyl-phosphate alpha-N-acetylglucosaminyl 1-phosphate transferase n=1 Tax=Fictibacillus nanhaiensis TaxID=742169 RepID=A0ABS2ZMU6_9BACL|nr:undecaprenyl/decaprenyl-phosphate alpha-N-acetylglucosaminyl 1-phosphate transferase [Fictibacillus nanhaiensis]
MDKINLLAFIGSFISVVIVTPFVIKFALKIGAVDQPNKRKVHIKPMPRIGGLAIFIGVVIGYFISGVYFIPITAISIGGVVILLLGIIDDLITLSAKVKLIFQIVAALIVISSGLLIEVIHFPLLGTYQIGLLSYPLTLLWIVGITNSINLIDGLDGLATGVSSIILITIGSLAFIHGKALILTFCVILLASLLGFLIYNFYPAKIFLGDMGALFIGYSISVISLLGLYKSVTLFSMFVPLLLLGVPLFDTLFAIIRRTINQTGIMSPDKNHLHHRLMSKGLSHKNAVLFIYGMGVIFSIIAITSAYTPLWGTIIILLIMIILLVLLAELVGLVNENFNPFMSLIRTIKNKEKKTEP